MRIKPRRVLLSTGAWGVSFLNHVTCYIYIDEEFFNLALLCGNSLCFTSLLKGMFLNFPFEDAPLMWWTINQIIQKYKLKFVFLDNLIYSPPYQWSPGTSICLCVLK